MSGGAKVVMQLGKIAGVLGKENNLAEAGQFVRSAAVMNTPVESGHLRSHIMMDTREEDGMQIAEIYTNVQYAPFVELGTGPVGAMNHAGISPNVTPAYTMTPWWIHESQLDIGIAEKYQWHYIDTPDGRFYRCSGQPAQPFLYPALKNNEKTVLDILKGGYEEAMRRAIR